MSNPAQGAVGVETKFKIGDRVQTVEDRNDDDDPGQITGEKDGWFEVTWTQRNGSTYGEGEFWWRSHELRLLPAVDAALATPRTDSDEGTAGDEEAAAEHAHFLDLAAARLLADGHPANAASCSNAAAFLRATLAPATPPGVPDSVRAPRVWAYCISRACERHEECRAPVGQRCMSDLATHPAGQSTTAEPDPALIYWIESNTERLCNLYPDAAASIVEFREELVGLMEGDPAVQSTGQGAEETIQVWPLVEPAPDSPLTGPVGVEELRGAVSKALHDNQFADGWPEMVDPVVNAVLAARPAAPEAQGAWSFDMEAAPRDGTPINVGRDNGCGWDLLVVWWSQSDTEYPWHTETDGACPEHRFDCWATLAAPAYPFGQEA